MSVQPDIIWNEQCLGIRIGDCLLYTSDMKKEAIRNGLPGKMDPLLTLQPAPEKMHRVSLQSIITHLLNLPETIR